MSSWQGSQLKYAFGLGGMMSFYGIIGLIVYLVPGQFVGLRYKILIIVLVLLTIPIACSSRSSYHGEKRIKKRLKQAKLHRQRPRKLRPERLKKLPARQEIMPSFQAGLKKLFSF